MASKNTLFMTPEESERVRNSLQDRTKNCQERSGRPREPSERGALIQEATASSVMQDLASAAFGIGEPQQKSDDEKMVAYAVGCSYLPCTTSLAELESMKLADLRMETHHRGRVLSLRRVSPVVELKASSWAVVQGDAPDDVERLEVFLHKYMHGKDVLDLGSEFLVKEPYYTLSNQGELTIRIDHPSDLVISSFNHDPEAWRNTSRDAGPAAKTAMQCKEEGNEALLKRDYAKAHIHYTEGLKLIFENGGGEENDTLRRHIHRNRSHVNLLLRRFDEAKSDALSSLTHGEEENQNPLTAKAYFRAGSAAYSLGNFAEAKKYFEEQEKLEPGNEYAVLNLRRIKLRLQEETSASYNMNKIIGALLKTHGRADVANYVGPTEIKKSPGAGRGLFAIRDIEPNEIILCEKAFCVVRGREPGAFSALTCDLRDGAKIRVFPAGLHRAVVQKLLDNPSQAEKVLDLFGDYQGLGNKLSVCDGKPVIDTFQLHDIVQRNAFGLGQDEDEDVSNASTGLWVQISYTNHSCVPNAKKEYVGDLIVLRATGRIAAGEEITHSYDESSDYAARTAALDKTWGFKCRCALCAAEEADGPSVRKKRQELEHEADAFIQKENPRASKRITITKARRLRRIIDETYEKERYESLPRRALAGIDRWLQLASSN